MYPDSEFNLLVVIQSYFFLKIAGIDSLSLFVVKFIANILDGDGGFANSSLIIGSVPSPRTTIL